MPSLTAMRKPVCELSKQLFEAGIVMERVQTRLARGCERLANGVAVRAERWFERTEVAMRRTIAQIRKELDSMRHDVAVVLCSALPFIQIYAWTTSPSLVPYGLTVAVQDLDRTPLSQLYEEVFARLSVMRSFHWPRASVTSRCWIELKRAVRW